VRARQGQATDAHNVAGVATSGEATFATEPPGLPGYVRAYFANASGVGPQQLTRDIRAPRARGESWGLVVEGSAEDPIHLDVSGLATVPEDLAVVLIPELTFSVIDLRARDALVLTGGETHRFELVIGDPSYVESVRTGQEHAPTHFALGLGYPNPLRRSTTVGFALPQSSTVELAVYDVQGRLVRTLASGARPSGRHAVTWDAADRDGQRVSPGVYFVRFETPEFDASRKLVVIH
jgi:hypothetical protein